MVDIHDVHPAGEYDFGGHALLDVAIGVDSPDVFVLTGLTLDLTGRVRRNVYSHRARFLLYPTMHAPYGFAFHVFTTFLRFSQVQRTPFISQVTVDVLSFCLQLS